MRPLDDDFDDFDFSDSPAMGRLFREQLREERRHMSRRSSWRRNDDDLDFDDDEDFSEYDDYDEEEFDSYAELSSNQ